MRIAIPGRWSRIRRRSRARTSRSSARLEAIPGVTSVGLSSSITMDGINSNDPIFVEDLPGPEGQMPPLRRYKWSPNYFETMGNDARRRARHHLGGRPQPPAGDDPQRNSRARVLGRARGRDRPSHPQQPEEPLARNRRRRRQRARGRRDPGGADDGLLADGDERLLGQPAVRAALDGLRHPHAARPHRRLPRRSAAGGVVGQSQPAARARRGRCRRSTTSRWRRPRSRW